MTMLEPARRYAAAGFVVLPMNRRTKAVVLETWAEYQKRVPTDDELQGFFANGEVPGLLCGAISGNLELFDIDHHPPTTADDLHTAWRDLVEAAAPGLVDRLYCERSQHGGYHFLYRCTAPVDTQKLAQRAATPEELARDPKTLTYTLIETKGEGGLAIVAPTPGYRTIRGDLTALPTITADERAILLNAGRTLNLYLVPTKVVSGYPSRHNGAGLRPGDDYNQRATTSDVLALLERAGWGVVCQRADGAYLLRRPGKTVGVSATLGAVGPNVLYVFSTNAAPFEDGRAYTPFAVYATLEHNGDFTAAAQTLAAQGYGDRAHQQAAQGGSDATSPLDRSFVLKCLGEGEAGDAQILAELYRGRLVYDTTAGAWYLFGQHIWDCCAIPPRRVVWGAVASVYLDLAARETRDLAEITDPTAKKQAQEGIDALIQRGKKLRDLSRDNNILTLAQELLEVTSDVWNTDPWLLSVQNGILDLRTGELRNGQPDDYISIAAPIEWRGIDEPCPRFLRFLDEVMSGEADRVAFLLRLLGYSLNGTRIEHILPICCGPKGRNGKGTLFETILTVLGPYAIAGSNDLLVAQGYDRSAGSATPHLMDLRGRRLVVCSETKETARLDTAQVKKLTGGDTIRGRGLHENNSEFKPSHTLYLQTNHRPLVPADEQPVWDRVIALDFKLRFIDNPKADDERQRDPNLETALLAEAPGILAALVRGHLDWLKHGLQPPASVKLAREQYRLGESIDPFLVDRCKDKPTAMIESSALYRAYEAWCAAHGLTPKSRTWFGNELKKRYEKGNDSTTRRIVYYGIALKFDDRPTGEPTNETPSDDTNSFGTHPDASNSASDDSDPKQLKAVSKLSMGKIPHVEKNAEVGFDCFDCFGDTNERPSSPMAAGVEEEDLPHDLPAVPDPTYRDIAALNRAKPKAGAVPDADGIADRLKDAKARREGGTH